MNQSRICITSAQSISGERALDAFADVLDTDDNTIDWEVVERECGPDAVVGRMEIVRRFRELYLQETGREIGATRARQLLREFRARGGYRLWRELIDVTDNKKLRRWAHACHHTYEFGVVLRVREELSAEEYYIWRHNDRAWKLEAARV
jgi:hypothetical protein